jgi:hypothetical protein
VRFTGILPVDIDGHDAREPPTGMSALQAHWQRPHLLTTSDKLEQFASALVQTAKAMNHRSSVVSLLAVLLLFSSQSFSQNSNKQKVSADDPFTAKHRELSSKNPQGLSIDLQLKDKQASFRPGEIIPLELRFRSSLPDAYFFDNASYDRSGRLDIDTFVIDRPGDAVDPLHDYYTAGLFGFMGGGLRGIGALNDTPQLVYYELNEWLRLEKPGKYRLYVVAGRIGKGKPYHSGNTTVRPASNIVEFEVLPPDPAWEKQALAEAVRLIDSNSESSGNLNDPHRAACRRLRFLGTEAATRESIRRFRGQDRICDFEYNFGLIGTPRREFTRAEMETALNDPDQPITLQFLNTISFHTYLGEYPTAMPPYPASGEAAQKIWQAQMKERRYSFDATKQKYTARLALAVKIKQRGALAISLETLLQSRVAEKDPGTGAELAASLAKTFFDLPVEKQRSLIEYQWDSIANQAMLPVLRRLYEHPPDLNEIPSPFPGLAVLRIYQLSPEEGRQLVLDEIKRPDLRVRISVLGLLPDKELPQLEEIIVERAIRKLDETSMALVSRYVSAAAWPQLRAAFDHRIGQMACAEQASLLSYFLRSDQNYGLEAIRKALRSRKDTHCYSNVLTDAADETISPEFEAMTLEYLNDPDPEVVFSAVKVLCAHGSIAHKPKIKAAIKRVIDRWREAKVDPEAPSSDNRMYPGYFAESLLRTYALAIPWITSSDEFKELAELCLNEQCRQQLKPRALTSDTGIQFFRFDGVKDERRFSVGYYDSLSWQALKEKLLQFPKETKFTWNSNRPVNELDRQLFDELQSYLRGKGFELVRFVPKPE